MPYESVILGVKWQVRVSDLTASDALLLNCVRCEHQMKLAPHVMYDRYPSYTRIVSIDKDFRCTKCGARELITWTVVRASFNVEDA